MNDKFLKDSMSLDYTIKKQYLKSLKDNEEQKLKSPVLINYLIHIDPIHISPPIEDSKSEYFIYNDKGVYGIFCETRGAWLKQTFTNLDEVKKFISAENNGRPVVFEDDNIFFV